MRITRKCSGDLHAHSLAKYDSNGFLVAYDNVGDVAGIVSQFRDEVITVNDIEETHHVCSLVYKDIGTCRVSGTVSAQGSCSRPFLVVVWVLCSIEVRFVQNDRYRCAHLQKCV